MHWNVQLLKKNSATKKLKIEKNKLAVNTGRADTGNKYLLHDYWLDGSTTPNCIQCNSTNRANLSSSWIYLNGLISESSSVVLACVSYIFSFLSIYCSSMRRCALWGVLQSRIAKTKATHNPRERRTARKKGINEFNVQPVTTDKQNNISWVHEQHSESVRKLNIRGEILRRAASHSFRLIYCHWTTVFFLSKKRKEKKKPRRVSRSYELYDIVRVWTIIVIICATNVRSLTPLFCIGS